MSGMGISGVGGSTYYQSPAVPQQSVPVQQEQESLAEALKREQDGQPDLAEMMKEAQEKAAEVAKQRDDLLKKTKSSRRYGDAAIIAYSKLARARSLGDVDAASGYARRQIAQLRAAKGSDIGRGGRSGKFLRRSSPPGARPSWRRRSAPGRPSACASS